MQWPGVALGATLLLASRGGMFAAGVGFQGSPSAGAAILARSRLGLSLSSQGCTLPVSLQDEKPGCGTFTERGGRINEWVGGTTSLPAPDPSSQSPALLRTGISSCPSVHTHLCFPLPLSLHPLTTPPPPIFSLKFDVILPTLVPAF